MDKYNDEDPHGLLKGVDQIYNGNQRKLAIHSAWDQWDAHYGVGKKEYEVYILGDTHQPGEFVFGPLTLYNKPRYVGSGLIRNGAQLRRSNKSATVGPQRDKGGEKVQWLEEMQQMNRKVDIVIINSFYTEKKARLIELKLLNLIPKDYLTNCRFDYCQIPLNPSDFIQPQQILTV
jgi:hypothetical protein